MVFRQHVNCKPLYGLKWPMEPVLNSGFLIMKRLGVLLLPPEWDASPSQGYPHFHTWVKIGTVRVKCLA